MKFRFPFCLLGAGALLSLPLAGQQDSPSPQAPQADFTNLNNPPLQIQDTQNPAPASVPEVAPGTTDTSVAPPAPQDSSSQTPAPAPAPSTPEPPDPSADSGQGSPGQNPPPSDPNSLIPPASEPEPPSPINAAGNGEKQRQEQKARYYTVKVKADQEEALVSLQAKADQAKSDEAKRQALRQYYDLLAKRMKKIDPSLSGWIDTMHAAYLRRLDQVRVEPTIPVNPPPAAAASPSPTSTPKKKKRSSSHSN